MGNPKHRKSKSKSRMHRSHTRLEKPGFSKTGDDQYHLPHRPAPDGTYRGRDYSKYVSNPED